METIAPIPLTRLKIADAPPEVAPENPPERFAQVMSRQEKSSRPKENPLGLDREGAGPKTPLTPEEKTKPKHPDPASDPEVPSFLTTPISNTVSPNPTNPTWEPAADLEDPTFLLKLDIPTPNPALASTEPIGSDSRIQPGPGAAKAFEDLSLYPTPESLPIKQTASPETTEKVMRSSQTATENGPSFSPPGPAIPETTSVVDGPDPSPALIPREMALKGQDGETPTQEIKPDSQAPPLKALSGTEKIATTTRVEGPPAAEANPVGSNSPAVQISATTASPATSKEIFSDNGISSVAGAEGLPDPDKASPTLTAGLDPKTSFLHRASSEKMESGLPFRDPGENLSGSDGSEMNTPIRFQEDSPLGVMAKFPDLLRVEGGPADRLVEGPPKGSPEWIKEALSVYQQYSKGLLRTLQQSGDRIQMTLDPPQLGSILMEINRDRNLVTAHLWTENPLTKELLDFSRGQLQKTLELDGFKLDRFEVLVQPDLKSFQDERWFGGRQPAWENSRQAGDRAAPEGLIPASLETAPLRFSQGNLYVDTWA